MIFTEEQAIPWKVYILRRTAKTAIAEEGNGHLFKTNELLRAQC
jgi:hypothetical protein